MKEKWWGRKYERGGGVEVRWGKSIDRGKEN
jgi:hypothetical protein